MPRGDTPKRRVVVYTDDKLDIVIVPFNYMVILKAQKKDQYLYYPTMSQLFTGLIKLKAENKLPKGVFHDIPKFERVMDSILAEVKEIAWTIKDHPMVLTGE